VNPSLAHRPLADHLSGDDEIGAYHLHELSASLIMRILQSIQGFMFLPWPNLGFFYDIDEFVGQMAELDSNPNCCRGRKGVFRTGRLVRDITTEMVKERDGLHLDPLLHDRKDRRVCCQAHLIQGHCLYRREGEE